MAAFVVDCSVAMTWLFKDEVTDATAKLLRRLASEAAAVPAWWFLEMTNVLAIAERKGRIDTAQTTEFLAQIRELELELDAEAPQRAFAHLLPLCRDHQLTSYDAVY